MLASTVSWCLPITRTPAVSTSCVSLRLGMLDSDLFKTMLKYCNHDDLARKVRLSNNGASSICAMSTYSQYALFQARRICTQSQPRFLCGRLLRSVCIGWWCSDGRLHHAFYSPPFACQRKSHPHTLFSSSITQLASVAYAPSHVVDVV
jgi:hypothetical protein